MTKVSHGWIPSRIVPSMVDDAVDSHGADVHDGEFLTGADEISEADVRWSDVTPLTTQQEVDEAGAAWGKEWQAMREPAPFVWPAHIGCPR